MNGCVHRVARPCCAPKRDDVERCAAAANCRIAGYGCVDEARAPADDEETAVDVTRLEPLARRARVFYAESSNGSRSQFRGSVTIESKSSARRRTRGASACTSSGSMHYPELVHLAGALITFQAVGRW
jgi:hypothetical protein